MNRKKNTYLKEELMIDKNGKVMRMTPTKRKEYLAAQLDLPRAERGLGKKIFTTKQIFTHLFKKETKNIIETLDVIRDIDPRTYLKVMVEMGKLSMVAEKEMEGNKNLNNELEELVALREKKVPKVNVEAIETVTDFVEVKDTPPIPKEPILTDDISHPAIKEDLRELGLPPIPKKK